VSLFKKYFLSAHEFADSPVAVIELLSAALPFTPVATVIEQLQVLVGRETSVEAEVERDWAQADHLLATFTFGAHSVEVAALPGPLPLEAMERTVAVSHWGAEFRAACAGHRTHTILRYAGASTDGIEQLAALYQVADALYGDTPPPAVVNERGWTAHPGAFVHSFADPALASTLRTSPPLPFWTGLLKLDADGEMLFLTRGYAQFGLPDLALIGYTDDRVREAQELLHDLFHYLYFETRDVRAGDFVTLADVGYLAFDDGASIHELVGGAPLLIVRPSTLEEIEHLTEANA
jgi:hypothetical protein